MVCCSSWRPGAGPFRLASSRLLLLSLLTCGVLWHRRPAFVRCFAPHGQPGEARRQTTWVVSSGGGKRGTHGVIVRAQGSAAPTEKQQLLGLLKDQRSAVWLWNRFLSEQGIAAGTQLADVPAGPVQEFLAIHSKGGLSEVVEFATPGMLSRLDALRRGQDDSSWHWEQHCLNKAFGIPNPKRLPAQIVKEFLDLHASGSFATVEVASDELASQVTEFQKTATGLKKWQCFVRDERLGNNLDPKKLPAEAVKRFLEPQEAGQAASGQGVQQPAWNAPGIVDMLPKIRLREAVAKLLNPDTPQLLLRRKIDQLTKDDISYEIESTPGSPPGQFTAKLTLNKALTQESFTGQGSSKKMAMDNAAEAALKKLLDAA
ncbi:unnamed protein product [Polarella glacialis]|uniref:DRBM domain-containing protein n=1 Tax=Polarella glacialis TaxID=89957 RepID=A0A813I1S6_POLGL|nr:unnamed protein product [Polarella glacialis]|mmetsp:Transcript_32310/g.51987  ORF Transcript_32310/g.51987 Transcript_32310/m.51987 type:complete len:373 (+) Transcript_32310:92-1210(+)